VATNTAVGLVLCGFALLLLQHVNSKARGTAVQLATFAVLAVGLTGVAGYSLDLQLLYPWFRSARMALPTAIGMVLAGTGLWLSWFSADWYRSRHFFKEDEKLSFVGSAALVVVAITAGIAGFAAQNETLEETLNENLTMLLKRRVSLFHNVIRHGLLDADAYATRPDLIQLMRRIREDPEDREILAQLHQAGKSMLTSRVSGVAIYDANDREIIEFGDFISAPEMATRLQGATPSTLLWRDALYLNSRSKIVDGADTIGYLVLEQSVPILTEQLARQDGAGRTGKIAICGSHPDHFRCLPWSNDTAVERIPRINTVGRALPMAFAIEGQSGIFKGPDYRGRNVIAAYGPVSGSSLGIVVKQDAEELYAPMRRQLEATVPLLILFVLVSAWLLRFHVKPLASRLLLSERDAREALAGAQASQERIRTIIETAQDAFIGMDLSGNITDWNPQAEKMFGWSRAEAIGRPFVKTVIPERYQANYDAVISRFNQTGEIDYLDQRLERIVVNRKGHEFPIELMLALAGTSESYFFSAFMRDISERKRVERMKNEFISTVSHELRTPLTSIRGSLGLLTGGAVGEFPPMAKGLLDIANANCEHLVRMTSGILDLEKIESGKRQPPHSPVPEERSAGFFLTSPIEQKRAEP
jgi:PAS domain S-box-containing protein